MTPAQLPRTELPTLGWSGRNSAVLEYLVVAALGGYWAWAKVPDWPWAVGCAALVLVLLGRLTRHQAIEWGRVPVLLQYRVLLPSRRIPLDAGTRVRAMSRSTTTGLTLLRGRQRAHVRLWSDDPVVLRPPSPVEALAVALQGCADGPQVAALAAGQRVPKGARWVTWHW